MYVIDDGSSHGIGKRRLKAGCDKFGGGVHFFESNQGKRRAHFHGVKKLAATHDFIVTIDSDTVLDEDVLIRLVDGYILILLHYINAIQ